MKKNENTQEEKELYYNETVQVMVSNDRTQHLTFINRSGPTLCLWGTPGILGFFFFFFCIRI